MEVLLATMTTPAQSLTQNECDELIGRILDMKTVTHSYLREIEEGYWDDINTMEINNFCTSIASIR